MRRLSTVLISATAAFVLLATVSAAQAPASPRLQLNDLEYFEMPGVNVMAFQDIYPEGHQGGVGIIQNGIRVATNGDLRLDPDPGQWQPTPRQEKRTVNRQGNEITAWLSYPDPAKNRAGFNPVDYPNLNLSYQVHVRGEGQSVRIVVDLERPLPADFVGKVGFNLELYPAVLFGKSWYLGESSGIFPRQANGPDRRFPDGEIEPEPLATGQRLVVCPEVEAQRLVIESRSGDLQLSDGRNRHNNGWFVVRSLVPAGVTRGAIEWIVTPHGLSGWKYQPVVHVSQVGYHLKQKKTAVIELDSSDTGVDTLHVKRISERGGYEEAISGRPSEWGRFLRYRYLQFDFTPVTKPGMYVIEYRNFRTQPFQISTDVYQRGVWQPVLEYFLPVQMCHMRVEEQYRVWHGACHLDDARMAPVHHNHFDGYSQGAETLTRFNGGDSVAGLNVGGWHDAGDDDLRVESQAEEVSILASAFEAFDLNYDDTTIDQANRVVRIHCPDGKPDVLQQIEHGVLTILASYKSMGRLYRGIIDASLSQYVLLGDHVNATDGLFYDPSLKPEQTTGTHSGKPDDRWVFTEQNAAHEYKGIAALAAAARVLKTYDPALASECLKTAEALWKQDRDASRAFDERIEAAVELWLTSKNPTYRQVILDNRQQVVARIGSVGWIVGRAFPLIDDRRFVDEIRSAVSRNFAQTVTQQFATPFGVPYRPHIWGAGWQIQRFGVEQYYLHRAFPDIVSAEYMLNALSFVLGVHPGENTASFASGVGSRSLTTAYGFNRADWSYIPGGVASGTALIRPDFPELKDFPYLWQQGEYVMGGGSSNFLFLVLAADQILNQQKAAADPSPGRETYLKLSDEVEATLRRDVLKVWFPRSVDRENGGFHSNFARDWQPGKSQGKFSVFQGRMTWVAAQVVMRRPELKAEYLPIAQHGVQFLTSTMWDQQYGGFFWGLDDKHQIAAPYGENKHLYGMSFCLYGLAAAYQATHDPKALEFAQKAFRWIDEHAHDAKNGGYFEWLKRDGAVIEPEKNTGKAAEIPVSGFPVGYKSMNTHIHLLESFTQLYEVWKDETLRLRLQELLAVVRDKLCAEPGTMNLYFTSDWQPTADRDSYGHDIEAAYLMLEAEDALGQAHAPATERMARMLVDHALSDGWDEIHGGFYAEGPDKPEHRLKQWWVEMEGLNSLLLMHEKYGRQTDKYFKAFQRQWEFIREYQLDAEFHGVYETVMPDTKPASGGKGHRWKAAYHDGRALMNVSERLRKLAEGQEK
jgi:endoglucanase